MVKLKNGKSSRHPLSLQVPKHAFYKRGMTHKEHNTIGKACQSSDTLSRAINAGDTHTGEPYSSI